MDDDDLYGDSPAPPPPAKSATPSMTPAPATVLPQAETSVTNAEGDGYGDDDDDDGPPGFSMEEFAPPEPEPVPAQAPPPIAAPVPIVPATALDMPSNTTTLPPQANSAGVPQPDGAQAVPTQVEEPEEGQEEEGEEEEEDEESEDDIEFIMEPASRSLDLRPNRPQVRSQSSFTPQRPAPPPSLTTEYTPRERNGLVRPPPTVATLSSTPSRPAPAAPTASQTTASSQEPPQPPVDDGPDPSTLPPVTAPASHPRIDPSAPGVVDGRPVFEVDIANLADKGWRKPGADLSDWFNYGFDEISWEAYCFRRREMGEAAAVLKTNVLSFAGMPEEQLAQLPPDVRAMVMASTNAMMNGGGGPQMMQGMMGPSVNEMEMQNMQGMNGMGMNMQNMQMQNMQNMPMMNPMMVGMDGGEQVDPAQFGGMPGPGEFGMQDPSAMQQQMFQGMEPPQVPTPAPSVVQTQQQPQAPVSVTPQGTSQVPVPGQGMRGVAPAAPFRGRGAGITRGARGFPPRGRGGVPAVPARAASPLPPNVPTGPRNQNKYKDRDNNAQAVEGLDYGGGERGSRTPTETHEDRSSRKRRDRSPPEPDRSERRDAKRR